jgi:2-keto-4-pentenoate hydratase/2-oxohepta-3-ene-1,7-dioic acid hydratase in catechol pathway
VRLLRLGPVGRVRPAVLDAGGRLLDLSGGVGALVHYLSQFMVLEPGDVADTGTPAGVALGAPEPKPWLRPGDVIEVEIDRLGRQRQVVGQA